MPAHAHISVVTGAAGFLGQALVGRLLAEGDIVRAIVLPGDPAAPERGSGGALEIVEADVTDYDSIAGAFRGAARVFHSAALVHAWAPRAEFRRVNVRGTQNVACAAREHGVERLVHISTTDVFGIARPGERMDERSPFREWNEDYADTKIEAERWLWQFHRETGLPLTVIYPGWVYGPGDRAFFPGLADAIASRMLVSWFGDVKLPWAYVANLVDACLLASTHPNASGRGYIVHDGMDGPTLEQVCRRIAEAIGAPPPRLRVPYWLMWAAAASTQGAWRLLRLPGSPPLRTVDVKAFGRQWDLSSHRIQHELGWLPRISTDEGMRRALDFLSQHWKARRQTGG